MEVSALLSRVVGVGRRVTDEQQFYAADDCVAPIRKSCAELGPSRTKNG